MVGSCRRKLCKRVGENFTQHGVHEKNLRYKLEIYQRNFPKFVYGNPTSIDTLSQDEEIEIGPNGIV
jgi:hypothetical protein